MVYRFKINRLFKYLALVLLCCLAAACATNQKIITQNTLSETDQEKQKSELDYLFFSAQKERLIGNFQNAIVLFEKIALKDNKNSDAHYQLARIYANSSNFAEAFQNAKKAHQLDPNNVWYLRLYIDLMRERNDAKETNTLYQRLLVLDSLDYANYFEWSAFLVANKDYTKALEVLNRLEQKTGSQAEIALLKKAIYTDLKQPEKAIAEIQKLAENDAINANMWLYLGQSYAEQKNYAKAIENFDKAQNLDAKNYKLRLAKADLYEIQNEHKLAIKELKIAFESSELNLDDKIFIAYEYLQLAQKKPELQTEAEQLMQILVNNYPDEPKISALKGDLYFQKKELDNARKAYINAIDTEKNEQKFNVWQQLLSVDWEQQRFDSLAADSRKALELFPSQPFVYYAQGFALNQLKKYQEAIDILQMGLVYVVGNVDLLSEFYAILGDSHHALQQFARSDNAYDQALSAKPNNAMVLNNYAYFLSMRKTNLEKAQQMSQKSLTIEPNNASFLDTYAWVLFQSKQYEKAKIYIEKAITIAGNANATLTEHLADIQYKLGNAQQAINNWKLAKTLGSDNPMLNKKIEEGQYFD